MGSKRYMDMTGREKCIVDNFDGKKVAAQLVELLRLRATPIGIKAFKSKEEMDRIEKLRYPAGPLNICQILAQAVQNGFTIGCTIADIDPVSGINCGCIAGLAEPTEEFKTMKNIAGGWFATEEDVARHQADLSAPGHLYEGLVASPLRSNRFVPDVCLISVTPGQAFMLMSAVIRTDYAPLTFKFSGESSCAQGWAKTLRTGAPGLCTPCYAELRFANFSDGEMLVSLTPEDLVKAIGNLQALSAQGLRYPIPGFGITTSPGSVIAKQYGGK